jgi:hypothetical protein
MVADDRSTERGIAGPVGGKIARYLGDYSSQTGTNQAIRKRRRMDGSLKGARTMDVSTTNQLTGAQAGGLAAVSGIMSIVYLALFVVMIIAYWKIFTKAGEEGWKCLIPIYNIIILLKIVGRPWWWLLLMFIPFVNFIILIIIMNDLSKSFGHGLGFTLGLIFLSFIFYLILGFGGSKYVGPGGVAAAPAYAPPTAPPPAPPMAPPA